MLLIPFYFRIHITFIYFFMCRDYENNNLSDNFSVKLLSIVVEINLGGRCIKNLFLNEKSRNNAHTRIRAINNRYNNNNNNLFLNNVEKGGIITIEARGKSVRSRGLDLRGIGVMRVPKPVAAVAEEPAHHRRVNTYRELRCNAHVA